jgi:hypothetical protein
MDGDSSASPDGGHQVLRRHRARWERPLNALAVVADVDDHRVLAVVQPHDCRGLAGMLDRVREGLLHHPVGREVGAWRQHSPLSGHSQLDRQAGAGDPVEERLKVIETGLRRQRCVCIGGTGLRLHALDRGQQAEQMLQLDHGRSAARLHGEQRRRRVLWRPG